MWQAAGMTRREAGRRISLRGWIALIVSVIVLTPVVGTAWHLRHAKTMWAWKRTVSEHAMPESMVPDGKPHLEAGLMCAAGKFPCPSIVETFTPHGTRDVQQLVEDYLRANAQIVGDANGFTYNYPVPHAVVATSDEWTVRLTSLCEPFDGGEYCYSSVRLFPVNAVNVDIFPWYREGP